MPRPAPLSTTRAAGDTGHVTDTNTVHREYNVTAGAQVRYVSKDGNDSYDGYSWGSAKLTVRAALESLPTFAGASGILAHYGTINVGRGTFDETKGTEFTTHVLDISHQIRLIGSGTGPGDRGTNIRLAAGQNVPLVDGNPGMGNDAHGVVIRDIGFDGNKANQTTSTGDNADTVIIRGGGFGYRLENTGVSNAKRWGINMKKNMVNVNGYELNFSSCGDATQGGAVLWTINGGPSQFTWIGGQIDKCGVEPLRIVHLAGGGAMMSLRDIKFENNGPDPLLHVRPIVFVPIQTAGGQPPMFTLESVYGNSPPAGTGGNPYFIYEQAGLGVGARWELHNINASHYFVKAFESAKTGQSSKTWAIGQAHFRGPETFEFGQNPVVEWSGAQMYVGTGTPEAVVTAPIGSLFLRKDGAATTTLYVKTSGIGNTGWTGK